MLLWMELLRWYLQKLNCCASWQARINSSAYLIFDGILNQSIFNIPMIHRRKLRVSVINMLDLRWYGLFSQPVAHITQLTASSLSYNINVNKNSSGDEIANVLVNDDIAHT